MSSAANFMQDEINIDKILSDLVNAQIPPRQVEGPLNLREISIFINPQNQNDREIIESIVRTLPDDKLRIAFKSCVRNWVDNPNLAFFRFPNGDVNGNYLVRSVKRNGLGEVVGDVYDEKPISTSKYGLFEQIFIYGTDKIPDLKTEGGIFWYRQNTIGASYIIPSKREMQREDQITSYIMVYDVPENQIAYIRDVNNIVRKSLEGLPLSYSEKDTLRTVYEAIKDPNNLNLGNFLLGVIKINWIY